MPVKFSASAIKIGATLAASGETENLATSQEIDAAVTRIRSNLDFAAKKAKAFLDVEKHKGAYD
ncbi:MAG: hypothetical protein ACOYLS_04950 [Polymorphobacter sp.]